MKNAILIIAHENYSHLCNFINCFDNNYNIYIHLDKKHNFSKDEIGKLSIINQVKGVYVKYKINWGGFNMLKSILFLLEKAYKDGENEYFHLFSGQDYPIKKISEFSHFIMINSGVEYLEYHQVPYSGWDSGGYNRYQYFFFNDLFDYKTPKGRRIINGLLSFQRLINLKRRIPDHFNKLYGGSCWFSLSRNCINYILSNKKTHFAFYWRLHFTFAPEETYFHSVVLNSHFREKVVNSNLRYIEWILKNNNYPANLDENDFFQIAVSRSFFARKFDNPWSSKLINLINKYLLASDDSKLVISDNGYWINDAISRYSYDKGLAVALAKILFYLDSKSIIDVGCGPAFYIRYLRNQGFDVYGYDGNPFTEEITKATLSDGTHCGKLDLTWDITIDKPYDIVLCLGVIEYIPTELKDQFIDNLTKLSKEFLILSWTLDEKFNACKPDLKCNESVMSKLYNKGFVENILMKNYLRRKSDLDQFKKTLVVLQKMST